VFSYLMLIFGLQSVEITRVHCLSSRCPQVGFATMPQIYAKDWIKGGVITLKIVPKEGGEARQDESHTLWMTSVNCRSSALDLMCYSHPGGPVGLCTLKSRNSKGAA